MNKQKVNKIEYDEDDESVDMEPFLKEVDKELERGWKFYKNGNLVDKIKYRWQFAKYYKNPVHGLLFALFGNIKDQKERTI